MAYGETGNLPVEYYDKIKMFDIILSKHQAHFHQRLHHRKNQYQDLIMLNKIEYNHL